MALPIEQAQTNADPRAVAILAKTIYRELRTAGYSERQVMSLASELLGMVATDVRSQRSE